MDGELGTAVMGTGWDGDDINRDGADGERYEDILKGSRDGGWDGDNNHGKGTKVVPVQLSGMYRMLSV